MSSCARCERQDSYGPALLVAYVAGTWAPARYSVAVALVTALACCLLTFLARRGVFRVPAWRWATGWRALVVFLVLWFGPLACPWTVVYLWR